MGRYWLICSSLVAAIACFSVPAESLNLPAAPGTFAAPPIVGFGGSKNMALWVASTSSTAKVELRPVREPEKMERFALPPLEPGASTQTLRLRDLLPDTEYQYTVSIAGKTSTSAQGRFRTSPLKGTPVRTTFVVASCMNVKLYPNQVAWSSALRENPALLIQLGDNIYTTGARPKRALGFHFRQRAVPEYRRLLQQTPVIAVWDDHDYLGNNSHKSSLHKEESLSVFREVFPNPAAGLPDTPGVFFSIDYGDIDIFMLDVRYHRSPLAVPVDERSILGEAQFAWLEAGLKSSRAKFKLIGSGSTFSRSEAWADHPRDLRRLFELTRQVPGIVMLTGDLHRSGFMEWRENEYGPVSYPVHEITSSGVAVKVPLFSYVSLHIDTTKLDPELKAVVHRVDETGVEREREERVILRSQLEPSH